jgi:hypothetical protein
LNQASAELNGIFAAMVRESPEAYPVGARLSLAALPDRLLGYGIGLGASLLLARLLGTLLFEVAPTDAATSSAVAILLGCVGLAAAALPAHRAATIDPMAALRRE